MANELEDVEVLAVAPTCTSCEALRERLGRFAEIDRRVNDALVRAGCTDARPFWEHVDALAKQRDEAMASINNAAAAFTGSVAAFERHVEETCRSCGGNPDVVIRIQREELAKASKRATEAEGQAELLRASNKSLESRVDWADRLRADHERIDAALDRANREVVELRDLLTDREALLNRLTAVTRECHALTCQVEKMQGVFDAAMAHYHEQAKNSAQAEMFAACAKVEAE